MTVLAVKKPRLTRATAAAAVIRRGRALSGIIGRKARAGGLSSGGVEAGLNPQRPELASDAAGEANSRCSGEMRRYRKNT